jgi:hypothetical protein
MNERIQQLAEQAWTMVSDEERNNGELYEADRQRERRDQVFAELIVQQCIEQASIGNGHGNNQWDRALTFSAKNIKEHFGVEE